jgi:Na+-transporting methylmalonyl-CoA/oxaloacetate decarboxylase gamma subunit
LFLNNKKNWSEVCFNQIDVVNLLLIIEERKMEEGMVFVLIILFAFVLPIVMVGTWSSHKKEMAKANANLNHSEKENMKNQLAAVKSRLEVLEAIVTDKKYQLDQEITQLKAVD